MLHKHPSFFDLEIQLGKIYEINDFLPRLQALIDWEMYRPDLAKIREKERLSNAGAKGFDVVLLFKCLVLKSMYNLSDAQTEMQIRDRLSFRDFLGLEIADKVPDEKTLWHFAEQLKNLELEQKLFDRFGEELDRQGFAAKSGLMVDGSFVEVPKQRNSREENAQIKACEVPERIASNPNILAQKDLDAEWAKKGVEVHFGYKDHVAADDEYKLIRGYGITGAATHDSEPYLDVVPEEPAYVDQESFADSAYTGERIETALLERGYLPMICEKGYRNKPLTEERRKMNCVKSKVRCRIEHIFGEMKMRMGNEVLRSIGFARARFWIGMRNLMYNMSRFVSLKRLRAAK